MKWSIKLMKALLLLASILSLTLPPKAFGGTTTVVSDTSWQVFGSDLADPTKLKWLGFSQNVCLNDTSPANCLTGGLLTPPTRYGYPYAGWIANVTGLPSSARWMWALKIDGATSKIDGESSPAASQEFTFQNDNVYVCNPAEDATISVAADNFAEVSVNGTIVPGSTSTSADQFTTFSIPASSIYGSTLSPPTLRSNTIKIRARNGLNPTNCGSDQYKCNPAGVIFWGSFRFSGDPKCPAFNKGGPPGGYGHGETETLDKCPDPQIGSIYHVCACGAWTPPVRACVTPPQCTGTSTTSGGMRFDVDTIESQSCSTGQSAYPFSHKCLSNGNWDVPLGACVTPPPPVPTCTGADGTTRVSIGLSETRNCQPPRVGTESRTCLAAGQFGSWSGACALPSVNIGEQCGSRGPTGEATAQCPSGTSCGPRPISSGRGAPLTVDMFCDPDSTLRIVRTGEKCGSRIQGATAQCQSGSTCRQSALADAFCAPNTGPPLPLGSSCTTNNNCGSTYCDAGFNTKQTNLCMPRGGEGLVNDPCTDNTQCTSGTCNNSRDRSGSWIAGQCR
jgi:hypothetical protein